MLMFTHNRECDNKLWFGELALEGFEQYVFNDYIVEPALFDSYDDFINSDWSSFVSDSAFM